MAIKTISLKIGNMRKAQEFVVYPHTDGAYLKIQSDDCIAVVDPKTGECRWTRNKGGAYFQHLTVGGNNGNGTEMIPMDVVQSLIDAQPKSGDKIGMSVYIA